VGSYGHQTLPSFSLTSPSRGPGGSSGHTSPPGGSGAITIPKAPPPIRVHLPLPEGPAARRSAPARPWRALSPIDPVHVSDPNSRALWVLRTTGLTGDWKGWESPVTRRGMMVVWKEIPGHLLTTSADFPKILAIWSEKNTLIYSLGLRHIFHLGSVLRKFLTRRVLRKEGTEGLVKMVG